MYFICVLFCLFFTWHPVLFTCLKHVNMFETMFETMNTYGLYTKAIAIPHMILHAVHTYHRPAFQEFQFSFFELSEINHSLKIL